MPVIPPGIPHYNIYKPCTMGDKGVPSTSIYDDLQRVLKMIHDERHLTAHTLYTSILHRIQLYDNIDNENTLIDGKNSGITKTQNKSKTFSSSFMMKRSGSTANKQQQLPQKTNESNEEEEEMKQVKEIIFQSKKHIFEKLENRCRLFRAAQMNFANNNTNNKDDRIQNNNDENKDDNVATNNNNNNEWIYASKHFGITTYYRREVLDQSLSIKLEGTVEGAALFEQICVLKEVDLHYLWSPFCTSSLTVANLDKLDIVGWFLIGLPNFGLARDGCYRVIGCDNIEEDGSIILTGRGIYDHPPYISTTTTNTNNSNGTAATLSSLDSNDPIDTFLSSDPILDKLDIPPVPTRMGSGRMTIRKFDAIIHITSPTSVRTQLIANMNPNISFLPNSLLEFGMKHLASVVLSKLQNAAKKASLHPVTNLHAIKMREEKEFYQIWLLEKFKSVCNARGWDLPPVAAFNLTEIEEHKAQRYTRKNKKDIHGYERAQTFSAGNPRDEYDDTGSGINSLSHDENDTNSEMMSALSTDTGRASVWSNNLIASYLRETERKIQQRKADATTEARQRAAERLQPKERSFTDEERLNALRLAKYRRVDVATATTTSEDNRSASVTSYYQRLAYQLYNHSPRTRYSIVLTLVCMLLLMLHAGVVVETSKILSTRPSMPWYINRSKDIGTITYIFLCTIPHFLLVNASLIYAFDALEIGSKSGRQAKTYYSDNVYGASIVVSFGIATISIILAMVKAFIRSSIWLLVKFWGVLMIHIAAPFHIKLNDAVRLLPKETLAASESVFVLIARTVRILNWIGTTVGSLIWNYFFKSNFIGQGITLCVHVGISTFSNVANKMNTFVNLSIKSFDGEVIVTSWRVEAFTTARFLYMNTAVFLLVTLTLFYMTSRNPTRIKTTKELHVSKNVAKVGQGDSATVAASPITARYAVIPEEGTVEIMDLHSFNPVESPPVESASADGGAPTNRRRRFRFLNRKVSSSPNISTPTKKQVPVDRNHIQHMKTM